MNGRTSAGFHQAIGAWRGWRGVVLDIGLGLVAGASFAPLCFWPSFALANVVFLWRIDGAWNGPRKFAAAFGRGFRYGLGFYLASLYWTANAFLIDADQYALFMPFLVGALIAVMALFPAFAAVLAIGLWSKGPGRAFALAFAMALADYLRGHIWVGLPWNLAGELWRAGGAMSQSAALVGAYGLSVITFFASFAPAILWDSKGRPASRLGELSPLIGAAAMMGALIGWGTLRLREPVRFASDAPVVRVVETGFSQKAKLDPNRQAELVDTLLRFTGAADADTAQIVIWPEAALPDFLLERADILERIEAQLGRRSLVAGVARREAHGPADIAYFNSIAVLAKDPNVGLLPFSVYDKVKLVPFGEFVPGGEIFAKIFAVLGLKSLSWVSGGFTPGAGAGLLSIPGAPPAAPLICYEGIFPGFVVHDGERPRWLVQVSNDAWFGPTTGPIQHYNQVRYRAIEQGLPLARAASGGVSSMVDPFGRTIVRLSVHGGYADSALPAALSITLYARFGDSLTLGLLALVGLTAFVFSRRARGELFQRSARYAD